MLLETSRGFYRGFFSRMWYFFWTGAVGQCWITNGCVWPGWEGIMLTDSAHLSHRLIHNTHNTATPSNCNKMHKCTNTNTNTNTNTTLQLHQAATLWTVIFHDKTLQFQRLNWLYVFPGVSQCHSCVFSSCGRWSTVHCSALSVQFKSALWFNCELIKEVPCPTAINFILRSQPLILIRSGQREIQLLNEKK